MWAVRLVAVEGFLNELPKGFSGDFNSAVTGAGIDDWWAGQGLFYGPLFVLEWLLILHPGYVSIVDSRVSEHRAVWHRFCLHVAGAFRPRAAEIAAPGAGRVAGQLRQRGAVRDRAAPRSARAHVAQSGAPADGARAASRRGGQPRAGDSDQNAAARLLAVPGRPAPLAHARAAAGVAAALFLGTCLVQGVSPWEGALMLLNQGSNLAKTKSTPYELGLRAFFIRLLTNGQGDPTPAQADLAFALHGVVAAATVAATAWIVWRAAPGVRGLGLAWGLVAATMLVVAPVTHIFYFVFLLPGLTAVLAELVERPLGWVTGIHWLGLLASYVFTGFDQPFVLAQRFLGLGQVVLDHWLDLLPLALLLSIAVQASMLHLYYSPRGTSTACA